MKTLPDHVKHLSLNFQQLDHETAFVALPGVKHHGLDFLQQAIEAKSPYLIIDAAEKFDTDQIPILRISNLKNNLGNFAAAFYGNPSAKLKVHAVTGTNGKTSCSQFIAQALHELSEKCGVVGTLGMGIWPDLQEIPNTTPDAITLQRFFAECVTQHIQHVSIEASSIALVAGRLQGCTLHSAIFTNLTQDHLDYHGTMQNYAAAKKNLFDFPGLQAAIFNADDAFGQSLLEEYSTKLNCWAYSTQTCLSKNLIDEKKIQKIITLSKSFSTHGITAEIEISQKKAHLNSALLGEFNLENLLAIFSWMLSQNIMLEAAIKIIVQLHTARGRMESVKTKNNFAVVVDYAHTPDALQKALQALRLHCEGRLWCIFGCGGNRDKTKRPLMGKIAFDFADQIIVTSDNPRDEDPIEIIQQICNGQSENDHIKIILDREMAIQYAMQCAQAKDIILIAGKGHETYQEIKGKKHFFDDKKIVEKFSH